MTNKEQPSLNELVFKGEEVRRFLNSPAGKEFIASVNKIADDARDELLHTDPVNIGAIAQLQERIKAHLHLVGLLTQTVNIGDIAYNEIEDNFHEG